MNDVLTFGELPTADDRSEPSAVAKRVAAACSSNAAFTLVEQRRWQSKDVGLCDVFIVECVNDQVPTKNPVGIRTREPLAIVLPRDHSKAPQVRALRPDFPSVMHLNIVAHGEPHSLCLYFEPWTTAWRTWTAERFLQRILAWLTDTANGTLHRPGQPVEPLYIDAPLDVVLPPQWENALDDPDKILSVTQVHRSDDHVTFRVAVARRAQSNTLFAHELVAIRASVPPVVHGRVEAFPSNLGELEDDLAARDSSILDCVRTEIARTIGGAGVARTTRQHCLLLLSIPTKLSSEANAERVDVRGFLVMQDLVSLGIGLGALADLEVGKKHYPVPHIGGDPIPAPPSAKWRLVQVFPVAVRYAATREFSRSASAVSEEGAEDPRLLAGVGALGSQLVELWSREGWGRWTLVDPDFIQPHNIVRHVASDADIGRNKAIAITRLIDGHRPADEVRATAFACDVLDASNTKLDDELRRATLVVDASTTLEVPRELSLRTDVRRCVSVFLTPSGLASAMLLEDESRIVRLDELEAQYYGAILSETWGEEHLAGHLGELWVGAGCRDVSIVVSNEAVTLHAAILARQVRLASSRGEAKIRVWVTDDATASVQVVDVPVHEPSRNAMDGWTVVSHEGISAKLRKLRAAKAPAETGGVIVGFIDQPLNRIFVVDVLPAPSDSVGTTSGFIRGVDGLAASLDGIRRRTAGIVGYLGEWHSHPPFNGARPSGDDTRLLTHCAGVLASDGVPALMMIVGAAGEISYSVGSGIAARI